MHVDLVTLAAVEQVATRANDRHPCRVCDEAAQHPEAVEVRKRAAPPAVEDHAIRGGKRRHRRPPPRAGFAHKENKPLCTFDGRRRFSNKLHVARRQNGHTHQHTNTTKNHTTDTTNNSDPHASGTFSLATDLSLDAWAQHNAQAAPHQPLTCPAQPQHVPSRISSLAAAAKAQPCTAPPHHAHSVRVVRKWASVSAERLNQRAWPGTAFRSSFGRAALSRANSPRSSSVVGMDVNVTGAGASRSSMSVPKVQTSTMGASISSPAARAAASTAARLAW